MTLMERRRALIGAQAEKEPPNKFVDGSFTNGNTSWSVDADGNVTIGAFAAGSSNRMVLQMLRKIPFESGDSIRVVVKKVSGTIDANRAADGWVSGFKFYDNQAWSKNATAIDTTVTASSASSSSYITLGMRANSFQGTNYKFSVTVYVNGTKIFPGV